MSTDPSRFPPPRFESYGPRWIPVSDLPLVLVIVIGVLLIGLIAWSHNG